MTNNCNPLIITSEIEYNTQIGLYKVATTPPHKKVTLTAFVWTTY